jgi:hypothetical protein
VRRNIKKNAKLRKIMGAAARRNVKRTQSGVTSGSDPRRLRKFAEIPQTNSSKETW